jgi:hypothetical protein
VSGIPELEYSDMELALGAQARRWSRSVRRVCWAVVLAGVAIGAGLFAVLG